MQSEVRFRKSSVFWYEDPLAAFNTARFHRYDDRSACTFSYQCGGESHICSKGYP